MRAEPDLAPAGFRGARMPLKRLRRLLGGNPSLMALPVVETASKGHSGVSLSFWGQYDCRP